MKKLLLILFLLILLSFCNLSFADLVRVIYRPDGGISVMRQNKDKTLVKEDFDKIQNKNPDLKDLPYDDIDSSLLPQSREDRNYWTKKDGGGVKIDTEKKNADIKKQKDKLKAIEDKLGVSKEELKELLK